MELSNDNSHRPVSREERAEWISRFRSSGLTQAQFAQQHGLKLTRLQWWLYRGRARAKPPTTTFQEIALSSLGPGNLWAAEVSWPNGVTVRLGAGVEVSWIEALLKAVHPAC